MKWYTKDDPHPTTDGGTLCLVIYNSWPRVLCWNERYKCWDDEDGDDYFCPADEIDRWIPVMEIDQQMEKPYF